jgi:ferredoxin
MKYQIDLERCSGHGRCYSLNPEAFEPNDLGYGHVIDSAHDAAGPEADAVIAACPEQAISLQPD